jgi:hypothetical protein
MALADPQSIKIGEVESSLPRTSVSGNSSSYTSEDGKITLTLSTTNGNRKRSVIRVDVDKITEDPFIPTQNTEVSMSFYMVIDRPPAGFDNTEVLNTVLALTSLGSASTNKVYKAWIGGQS